MTTPVLSKHARERCAEMGISTKIAKRIVQNARVTYRGTNSKSDTGRVALCPDYPDYAVVFAEDGKGGTIIITVLFNTPDRYVRLGETFIDLTDKVVTV